MRLIIITLGFTSQYKDSMKRILGLDLGVSSIGWALVDEAESQNESSSIIRLGVRVNPLTTDESVNYEKGKSITTNAERTLKRGMRRNLQRYKLRRKNLIEVLKREGFITDDAILSEDGNKTTFETYRLRAKAAKEEVSLEELARIFLMINKKRGYKSNRKAIVTEEGQAIDSMEIAKYLYNENLTPGQYSLEILKEGKKHIPNFYRSDLVEELDRIWNFQVKFHPTILTDDFRKKITDKKKLDTSKLFLAIHGIYTAENKGKDKRIQSFQWRVNGLKQKISPEILAFVIGELNGQISNSSGLLGEISDRSKELYFNKQTVGEYLMKQLEENPHARLKNQVFYRQDYLDEFETLWETQAKYHRELTPELKSEIRDVIIFYQRKLKSQKGLISFCEFESRQIEIIENGKRRIKTNGLRVCPKSSPLFQEFKLWQTLNNLKITEFENKESRFLTQEEKELLFNELNIGKTLKDTAIIKTLSKNPKNCEINYKSIEGNQTQAKLFSIYEKIIEYTGHSIPPFNKMNAELILETTETIFKGLGYNTGILSFDSTLEGKEFEQQDLFKLWHLLYSFEGDEQSKTGNDALIKKISELFGFEKEFAALFANINFENEYGNLSSKAIRKILPYLKQGYIYSDACEKAGYKHSKSSLTKAEIENKKRVDQLEILPKNSLRNPVVEKILNQMIHVVNSVVEKYGKPDEIRIELSRELKKSAKQREEMTLAINKATLENQSYREILQSQFNIMRPSRNDIIRFKLYKELKNNGYHTLYSNTYISPKEIIFSKSFDIEHIIPQSRLFDDSFSNKTLELSSVNQEKGNDTAYDYILRKKGEEGIAEYMQKVEHLYRSGAISKTKYNNLMRKGEDIPNDFINRDLNDTQYISRKAKEILETLVKNVSTTTGSVTNRLREDWQLVDVLQELNWNKYDKLGLTEVIENKEGHKIKRIIDWTKRNDHRHHAMDALTIAFTRPAYIQYLNNLNARSDRKGSINAIEKKYLKRDLHNRLRFIPPIPLSEFRNEAKKHLEHILISIKAKNKVVTTNINRTQKKSGGVNKRDQLTPRGRLHEETIYGSIKQYKGKAVRVGSSMDEALIKKVCNKKQREALLARLQAFNNDPKKAFTGKNSPSKNPIYIDSTKTEVVPEMVKIAIEETIYTLRKEVSPDLKLELVVDKGVKRALQKRLDEYQGNRQKAFSDLDTHPIWLNKEKGLRIKYAKIRVGISNPIALRDKIDKEGRLVLGKNGKKQGTDFIKTGNNHHIAIYMDKKGNLQEKVISFYETTMRAIQGMPVVDKNYNEEEGWEFLFTMKINECFIFPNEKTGFDPKEINLLDLENYAQISPNLFRVQKLSSKDYSFRHHLETNVEDPDKLRGVTWIRLRKPNDLRNIVKVRINHIGEIVDIGEY